jgi:hypothetical protein
VAVPATDSAQRPAGLADGFNPPEPVRRRGAAALFLPFFAHPSGLGGSAAGRANKNRVKGRGKRLRRPGSQTLDPFVFGRPFLPVAQGLIQGSAFFIIEMADAKNRHVT